MSLFSPQGRSTVETTTGIVVLLAFFFALGLAGGAYFRSGAPAEKAANPAPAAASPAASEAAAQDLAKVSPTAPAAGPAPFSDADQASASDDNEAAVTPPWPSDGPPEPSPPAASPSVAPEAPPPAAAAAPEAPAPAAAAAPAEPASAAPAPRPRRSVAQSTKARAPAAEAHAATAARGPVRIQFGAFASETNAQRVQWAVEAAGMQIEITHQPDAAGRALYTPRSTAFPDVSRALEAAASVRDKARHFATPVTIDYVIVSDRPPPPQQAELPQP